ncbi:TonB-dependent receptor [soil metagenome]
MKMFKRLVLSSSLLIGSAYAQQTGIAGHVTDPQGAVITGASVEVKQEGGGAFKTKTTSQGTYLIPSISAGDYVVTITAPGFSTVKTRITMLVGQTPDVETVLPLEGANTNVVVTSDSTAVDTTSSTVAGNVTPQEVQGLPINGRNYMQLSALVPGIHINAITADVPVGAASESGKFQITMDGLQVSQDTAGSSFGQPRFSQDAISQFQIITNRFDATLGRSAGVYVNAQSKSGANTMHGGAFGYFRNDSLNASDPITRKVLPFSDQQYGGTIGGPIMKDKLWYFGSYEGERSPSTSTTTSNLAGSSPFSHPGTLKLNEFLGRGDYQINSKNKILLSGDGFNYKNDYSGVSGNTDPSTAYYGTRVSYGYVADWNSNISNNLVNDFRAGFHHFGWQYLPYYESIQVIFPNVTVGGPYNYPQIFQQNTQQYRDDLFWLKGKHSIKVGAELLYTKHGGFFQQNVRGRVTSCGATPTAADVAAMFPKGTTDVASWNLTAISNVCNRGSGTTYVQGYGDFTVNIPRTILGVWVQDDWKILPRLTLNLGLRYDNDLGAFTGGPKLTNGLLTPQGNDNNNIAPRVGLAYDPWGDGKTVIRGGAGLYYADVSANQIIDQQIFNGVSTIQASVSGTNVNLANPFNGGNPATNPGAYLQAVQPLAQNARVPYALQVSFGVQRELPFRTTLTADLVHNRAYNDWLRFNGNLLVDPSNPQRNLNPNLALASSTARTCGNGSVTLDTIGTYSTATKQVCNQQFTSVSQFFTPNGAGSIYDGLQVGLKKNTQAGFTGGLAYTFARTKNSTEGPFYYANKPFAKNVKDEWANGTDDQRHSLTVTGEYKWRYGLALSSLYRFGSGAAFATSTGTAAPNGAPASFNRTVALNTTPVAPGTACAVAPCVTVYAPLSKFHYDAGYGYYVMDRNALRGRPIQRVDSRLQETIPVHERYKIIVAVEAFNLFNHSNYGNYVTTANSATYGNPASTSGSPFEFSARQLQFIGRFQF